MNTKKLRIKYLSQNGTKIGAMHTFKVCFSVLVCVRVCKCVYVSDLSVSMATKKPIKL